MPSLTEARAHKRGSSVKFDFNTVWEITDPSNIAHNGRGLYSYIGDGGSSEEDIGTIRTLQPLNPNGGISSFEITLLDTGRHALKLAVFMLLCSFEEGELEPA